ncbi:hypothetical protein ACHAXT_012044 [Thalassiosira profunda]
MRLVHLAVVATLLLLLAAPSYASNPPAALPLRLPTRSDVLSTLLRHRQRHHRLQEEETDKFASLNEVLSSVVLNLPDAQVSEAGLDLTITNISCRDITVQDIEVTHTIQSDTLQSLGVGVDGVEVVCDFNWEAGWLFFGGSGIGTATSDPSSSISTSIDFVSEDFATAPPTEANIGECNSNLQIAEITVDDDGIGILSTIINTFEGLVRDTIEGELDQLICDQITGLGEEGAAFDDLLTTLADKIEEFSGDAVESSDPLSAERNAVVPTDENGEPLWVNFVELEAWVEDLLDTNFDELMESVLGSSTTTSEGEEELGINSFMRKNVLDEDGMLVFDTTAIAINGDDSTLFELHDTFMQTSLSIESISIGGLDSFGKADVLDPIGNYTLQNSFELEYLTVRVEMEATLSPSSKSDAIISANGDVEPVTETFVVEFTVNDVAVDFAVFLGINKQTLGQIQLGSIIFMENILPCALGAVDEFELTALSVSVSDVTSPILSGFSDPGLDHVISTGAQALFEMYEPALIDAVPGFFESTLRDLINDFVADALTNSEACPSPNESLKGLVDYRDLFLPEDEAVALLSDGGEPYGDLFHVLYAFLDQILTTTDEDGLSWLNALIVQLTGLETDDSGDLYFPGDLVSQTVELDVNELNAMIYLGVSDVRISNLASLGALHLLQPMYGESDVLNNTASIGAGPEPIRMEMTMVVKGKGDEVEAHNEFVLAANLNNISVALELLAQMQEPPFLFFPLEDVTNLNCWMYTMVTPVLNQYGYRVGEADTGVVLQNLAVAVAEASLEMTCISCSSPMMLELEETLQSEEGVKDTTEAANSILQFLTSILSGDLLQTNIDRMLNEAAYRCPHSPTYQEDFQGLEYEELEPVKPEEDSYGFLIAVVVVVAVVAAASTVIFFVVRWAMGRRHRLWMSQLNRAQKLELARMQENQKERAKDLNTRMRSLAFSKEVPCLVRPFIPLVIFGNIALFVSGHLSLGGTVTISGSFAGTDFSTDGFFEFSMVSSTIEMWNAGAKALAILIGLFSILWPYTKQILTLVMWLLPTKWLPSQRRGRVLHWLDVLGKWSMVDIFVLLVTLASFRIEVESPDHLSFLPEDLYSLNLMVVPKWGLYANMLAQLVAQVSSHVILHYHRKTVRAATKVQEVELNLTPLHPGIALPQKLRAHRFSLDYEASHVRAGVRKGTDWALGAALLSLAVLVICGCSFPSFTIEVLGLVGIVVESGNQFEQASTSYSVFGLASMIMDRARSIGETSDYIGLGTLASLLVITVFIVPLAQTMSLLAQWFAPMTKRQRSRNTVFNEILSAWQYTEVYVLSIIIGAWQISGVSAFMIDPYCGALQDTLSNLARYGIIDRNDARCFRVTATVEAASWLLVAASLVLGVVNHLISAAAKQKRLDDRTQPEMRLHTDRWDQAKPPQSKLSIESANTADDDDEGGAKSLSEDELKKVNVSPISPRFTDYYRFACTRQTAEPGEDENDEPSEDAETAVVEKVEKDEEQNDAALSNEAVEMAVVPNDESNV